MNGQKLIGLMLLVGIITLIGSFFFEPGGGDESDTAASIAAVLNAPVQTALSNTVAFVGMILILLGLAYYARRNQSEDQPDIVSIASSLALVSVVAAAIAVNVFNMVIDDSTPAEYHELLYRLSDHLFIAMVSLIGLSLLLLALGLFRRQTTLLLKASWGVVALIGLSLFAMTSMIFDDMDGVVEIIGSIGFFGFPLVPIVLGVRSLRAKE